jgi:hypothetical protein
MVWSSASTTRTRVKSEGCGSGVAVASDIVGSWRTKVIGALSSLIGGLTGRAQVTANIGGKVVVTTNYELFLGEMIKAGIKGNT